MGKGQDGIGKQEETILGVIRIKDTIRKDASDALRLLDSVILSSGDNETGFTSRLKIEQ